MYHHDSSRTPQHSKWNCVGTNKPRHIHMYGHIVCDLTLKNQKFESFKNNSRDDEIRIRICQLIPTTPQIVRIGFGRHGTPIAQLWFVSCTMMLSFKIEEESCHRDSSSSLHVLLSILMKSFLRFPIPSTFCCVPKHCCLRPNLACPVRSYFFARYNNFAWSTEHIAFKKPRNARSAIQHIHSHLRYQTHKALQSTFQENAKPQLGWTQPSQEKPQYGLPRSPNHCPTRCWRKTHTNCFSDVRERANKKKTNLFIFSKNIPFLLLIDR